MTTLQSLIAQSVKAVTGISVEAMQVRTRKGHIVDARRMYSAILREMTGMKIDDIAATMNKEGGNYCNHPNVMHYIKTDRNMVETEPLYRRQREEIVRRVNRLYKPDFTSTDAWGNLWEGVTCRPLI
jgi:chromosomal replication initiation ATPase DnaA